ncbi:unnamed protein product, partial [Tetraodon nigroviridis]
LALLSCLQSSRTARSEEDRDTLWDAWGSWSECSRTCGGGASYSLRRCLSSKTAPRRPGTSGPSSARLTPTCVSRAATTSGCQSTTTRRTHAPSSAGPGTRAWCWSWPPKSWTGRAATARPWTCASAAPARWDAGAASPAWLFSRPHRLSLLPGRGLRPPAGQRRHGGQLRRVRRRRRHLQVGAGTLQVAAGLWQKRGHGGRRAPPQPPPAPGAEGSGSPVPGESDPPGGSGPAGPGGVGPPPAGEHHPGLPEAAPEGGPEDRRAPGGRLHRQSRARREAGAGPRPLLTLSSPSAGEAGQRRRQHGPVQLLPAHRPPLEGDRLLPLLRQLRGRLPADLGRVPGPALGPRGGRPGLPAPPGERQAQTQTAGVQPGALPRQRRLQADHALRPLPPAAPVGATAAGSARLAERAAKVSSFPGGRAAPGLPAPPPVEGASRAARCPAWRRTCRAWPRLPRSGSVCTRPRPTRCRPATTSPAPAGWPRTGPPARRPAARGCATGWCCAWTSGGCMPAAATPLPNPPSRRRVWRRYPAISPQIPSPWRPNRRGTSRPSSWRRRSKRRRRRGRSPPGCEEVAQGMKTGNGPPARRLHMFQMFASRRWVRGGAASADRSGGELSAPAAGCRHPWGRLQQLESLSFVPGPWQPCSSTCGAGTQQRSLSCRVRLSFSQTVADLPDPECQGPKPPASRPCRGPPCPQEGAELHHWEYGGFAECSESCGGGTQEAVVVCLNRLTRQAADQHLCVSSRPPPLLRACRTQPCPPRWVTGEWTSCSAPCGVGLMSRSVECVQRPSRDGGRARTLSDQDCRDPKPSPVRACNRSDCAPVWEPGAWGQVKQTPWGAQQGPSRTCVSVDPQCSRSCGGGGVQSRRLLCRQRTADGSNPELPGSFCPTQSPPTQRPCSLRPCGNALEPEVVLPQQQLYVQWRKSRKLHLQVGGHAYLLPWTTLLLRCPAHQLRKGGVRWLKDGRPVSATPQGQVKIQQLRPSDAGVYTCVAASQRQQLVLHVLGGEKNPSAPDRYGRLVEQLLQLRRSLPEDEDVPPVLVSHAHRLDRLLSDGALGGTELLRLLTGAHPSAPSPPDGADTGPMPGQQPLLPEGRPAAALLAAAVPEALLFTHRRMEGERERRKAEAQGKKTETEKKKRSRVKQLLADVKKQVEFWFGDVNLHKDRFLRKVMEESEDGYVDISVLTSFNRMKKLTADARLVARALRNSPVVEVNLEGNKVRRRHPIGEAPADVDDRTVYVVSGREPPPQAPAEQVGLSAVFIRPQELLPKDVTHGWIERVFSQCGTVVYVSVPRYKSSGDSKGFAFVEFEKAEEAREAIQALNNPPQDAPRKAGIFPKTRCGKPVPLPAEEEEKKKRKKKKKKESSAAAKEAKGPPTGAETPAPKRRRSAAEGGGAETRPRKPAEKKRRRSQTTDESESDVPAKIRKTRETDAPESSSAVQSEAEKDGKENGDEAEIKAKRRRKKKHKEKLKIGEEVNPCASSPRGVPAAAEAQHDLAEEVHHQNGRRSQRRRRRRCRREPASGQSGAAFAPGVIVKITDSKALPARSRIKDALSRLSPVAYVDVLEGDAEGHVRFHSPEDARAACEGRAALQKELGWRLEVISGEREQRYWQKILVDRQVKLNRPREKKRGAEKVRWPRPRASPRVPAAAAHPLLPPPCSSSPKLRRSSTRAPKRPTRTSASRTTERCRGDGDSTGRSKSLGSLFFDVNSEEDAGVKLF